MNDSRLDWEKFTHAETKKLGSLEGQELRSKAALQFKMRDKFTDYPPEESQLAKLKEAGNPIVGMAMKSKKTVKGAAKALEDTLDFMAQADPIQANTIYEHMNDKFPARGEGIGIGKPKKVKTIQSTPTPSIFAAPPHNPATNPPVPDVYDPSYSPSDWDTYNKGYYS